MADFDSKLPIRSVAVDNTTEIADSTGATIDPATENGNLGTIAAWDNGASKANVVIQSDASVDLTKVAGNATAVNTGNANTGTQRVVLASDQPAVSVALAANQSVNVAQIAGTATSVNTGNASAGTQRVVIASDQPAIPVTVSGASNHESTKYQTATKAANATDTNTLSPASTVEFDGFEASASGQLKVELKIGTTGSETSRGVWFTSKGDMRVSFRMPNPVQILNTMSVVLLVTNLDNQSMDVYSTILTH